MRPCIAILGKLPPPYFGPAVATRILLGSALRGYYYIQHVNTNTHKSIGTLQKLNYGGLVKNVGVAWRLSRAVLRHRPRLVLVPISQSTLGFVKDSLFVRIARKRGRVVLLQLRGSNFLNWYHAASPLTRRYVRHVLARTDGMIVLSDRLRGLFTGFYPPERVYVAVNGADYRLPERTAAARPGGVLYFANIYPSKGAFDFIEAVRMAAAAGCELEGRMVGGFYNEEVEGQVRRAADEPGVPLRVFPALGGVEKFAHFLDAEVFVFPPREPEGMPWVIIEALAAGLPIIATNQGAIADAVIDGHNGFIVEPGRPDLIAEKITVLLGDPELRAAFGRRSRAIYEERYTERAMVDSYRRIFDAALGRESPSMSRRMDTEAPACAE